MRLEYPQRSVGRPLFGSDLHAKLCTYIFAWQITTSLKRHILSIFARSFTLTSKLQYHLYG